MGLAAGPSAPAEATDGQVLAIAALASIVLPAEIDPAKLTARFIRFEQAIRHLVAAAGAATESGCDSAPRPPIRTEGIRAGCQICGQRFVRPGLICSAKAERSHCRR